MARALSIEMVSKKYVLKDGRPVVQMNLRDSLSHFFREKCFAQKLRRTAENGYQDFWALKDISFDAHVGEKLGIIGKNGAGKSTLLKIITRITEPSEGTVRLRGRVASMLEVGTGFHRELSGRENVYLYGAIHGMTRNEVKKQLEQIIEFAEVRTFIDTPLKFYSTGMYLRLAFSVAAHLDPEIFIVDEILAVGDLQFQKKCIEKMRSVSKSGKTILFVSHNMETIAEFCDRVVVLSGGKVVMQGEPTSAIKAYIRLNDADEALRAQ